VRKAWRSLQIVHGNRWWGKPQSPSALPASAGPSPLQTTERMNKMLTAKSVVLVIKTLLAASSKSKSVDAGLSISRNEQKSFLHFNLRQCQRLLFQFESMTDILGKSNVLLMTELPPLQMLFLCASMTLFCHSSMMLWSSQL